MPRPEGAISFVIPVRDDAQRLRRCLESIADNGYPRELVQVVVVDNGSKDDSAEVARRSGAVVENAANVRVAEMRNIGARIAAAPALAFVDADHILSPGWINAAVSNLQSNRVAGAGSLCRAPEGGTWVQRAYDRLRGRVTGRADVEWLGAGNMVIRKDAFEQVGGFDTSLETCEDVDLCKRLRNAGFRLVSDERMGNVHLGDPDTLGALFRGELWRGRSNLAVSFRPPVTLREMPSALVPIVQLISLVAALTSVLLLGNSGIVLALVALTPLLIVPLLRSWRMSAAGGFAEFVGNFAVAVVYDMARALALVAFATHQTRR